MQLRDVGFRRKEQFFFYGIFSLVDCGSSKLEILISVGLFIRAGSDPYLDNMSFLAH